MTRLVIVGGSDAGISAGLCARDLDWSVEPTLVIADAYPNFSICGIPYWLSGEVGERRNLAHRTREDLERAGLDLRLETVAKRVDVERQELIVRIRDGREEALGYDRLVIATGAVPARPPIPGIELPGVHLLHSMGDATAVHEALNAGARSAVIIGAGYIGVEMADADHKSYYPGAHPLRLRIVGDREHGVLLGAQILGHVSGQVAKRIDTLASAIYHRMTIPEVSDLDLSYTPPLSSPWDPVQIACQAWERARRRNQTSNTIKELA